MEYTITDVKDTLENQVKRFIAEFAEVHEEEVKPEAHLKNDLGLDSLEICELEVDIEQKFNIRIPVSSSVTLETVQDYIDEVEDRYGRD